MIRSWIIKLAFMLKQQTMEVVSPKFKQMVQNGASPKLGVQVSICCPFTILKCKTIL